MAQPETSADAHIRDLVRRGDQDRYWSALLAPEAARPHLLALFAFDIELSRIAWQVSEPQLGEIRLQWWRDALSAALTGAPTDHPVLARLAEAVALHRLPHEPFLAMIDAHGFDVHGEPMPDGGALQDYLAATGGLGVQPRRADPRRGASSARPAHSPPAPTASPACCAPCPTTPRAAGYSCPPTFSRGTGCIRTSSSTAATMPTCARRCAISPPGGRHAGQVPAGAAAPRQALPAFLPLALVEPALKKLAAPDHHPLRDVIQLNPIVRYGLIWRAFLRGRI